MPVYHMYKYVQSVQCVCVCMRVCVFVCEYMCTNAAHSYSMECIVKPVMSSCVDTVTSLLGKGRGAAIHPSVRRRDQRGAGVYPLYRWKRRCIPNLRTAPPYSYRTEQMQMQKQQLETGDCEHPGPYVHTQYSKLYSLCLCLPATSACVRTVLRRNRTRRREAPEPNDQTQRNATQRNATQRNATQRNAMQRNVTKGTRRA